jgi:hypothetical protein
LSSVNEANTPCDWTIDPCTFPCGSAKCGKWEVLLGTRMLFPHSRYPPTAFRFPGNHPTAQYSHGFFLSRFQDSIHVCAPVQPTTQPRNVIDLATKLDIFPILCLFPNLAKCLELQNKQPLNYSQAKKPICAPPLISPKPKTLLDFPSLPHTHSSASTPPFSSQAPCPAGIMSGLWLCHDQQGATFPLRDKQAREA